MKTRKQTQKTPVGLTFMVAQKGLSLLLPVLLMLGATSVSAQEKSADQWQFDTTVYLWGSTIKSTTATGDSMVINFGTIFKNLDFAGMATFGVRKNKFSMLTDVIYLNISDSKKNEREFLGQPVTGKLEIGMTSWVLNFIGGYNLVDSGKNQLDIAAGARYLDVKLDGTLELNDHKFKKSAQDHVWDGVIGFKGRHNYPDGYYFNYYADIGTGDSDLTYQAVANFSYDYKKFTGVFGYRYLKWEFSNDSPALQALAIHGPYIGARFSF